MKKLLHDWVSRVSEVEDRVELYEMMQKLEGTGTPPSITVTSPKYESCRDQIKDEIKLWTASCANDPDNVLSPIRAPSKKKLKDLFELAAKKLQKQKTLESEIRFKEIREDDFTIHFAIIDANDGQSNEFVVIYPEQYHSDTNSRPLRVITRVVNNEKFVTFVIHLNKFIEKESSIGNHVNVTILLTKASELYSKIVSGEELESDDEETFGIDRLHLDEEVSL
jgi:hypothetical protein